MTTRTLVLGGGGVTGVAWELGVLAGLAEAGIDLTGADLIVGTSAGSVVAAQISSGTPLADLYAAQLAGAGTEVAARVGPGVMARYTLAMVRSRDPQRFRAQIGKMALAARTVPQESRRRIIESRLPSHKWPTDQRLVITAVQAQTGEFTTFDADSGVSLVDAVAASCAVPGIWPPVTIGEHRYIDGGVRSMANADLAAGADRIVILAPLTTGAGPVTGLAAEVAQLRRDAQVAVVHPDRSARGAIGRNVLDPAHRAPAARAGHAQAAAEVAAITAVWS